MLRASRLYQLSLCLVCFAAGASSTWYITRVAFPTPVQQDAAAVPPPVRTVSWFAAHPSEMRQKFAACNDNPGGAMTDPECENALTAREHTGLADSFPEAPR
jgi:hypothetical protein